MTMEDIRDADARIGILNLAANERSTYFDIDLRDPDLRMFGFGMDDNGTYPAL